MTNLTIWMLILSFSTRMFPKLNTGNLPLLSLIFHLLLLTRFNSVPFPMKVFFSHFLGFFWDFFAHFFWIFKVKELFQLDVQLSLSQLEAMKLEIFLIRKNSNNYSWTNGTKLVIGIWVLQTNNPSLVIIPSFPLKFPRNFLEFSDEKDARMEMDVGLLDL